MESIHNTKRTNVMPEGVTSVSSVCLMTSKDSKLRKLGALCDSNMSATLRYDLLFQIRPLALFVRNGVPNIHRSWGVRTVPF